MTNHLRSIFVIVFVLLALMACNPAPGPNENVETEATATVTPATLTDAPTLAATPTEASQEAAATEAPQDTPAPNPTSAPEVKAQALTNLNLRAGPGTNFSVVGSLPAQAEVTLIGRNDDSSWLQAEDGSGAEVWLSADPALVQTEARLVTGLPVISVSPPAYDASHVKVNEILEMIPLVLHNPGNFTCASHAGLNNLLISLAEDNVLGPHAGDFVHTELGNVLFRYKNGSLRLMRENPLARFEGGEEMLPLDTALKMFELGEIVWNGQFGEWPARGVTGCDESAKP